MHNQFCGASFCSFRRMYPAVLVFVSVLGLLFGIWSGMLSGSSFVSLMRSCDFSAVSIVSLIVISLPFLISALAVVCSCRYFLFAVVFGKAFSFGFSGMCCFSAFQSAGWLVFFLLFFMDICLFPVLYWFVFRHIAEGHRSLKKDLLICTGAVCIVGGLNLHIISPLLAELI